MLAHERNAGRIQQRAQQFSDLVAQNLKEQAEGDLEGILGYTDEPLVSSDYIGNPHSCILDSQSTNVIDGTLVKVSGWYDNEWGYSVRVSDLTAYLADHFE